MQKPRWILTCLAILIVCSNAAFTTDLAPVSAPNPPPGPDRYSVITVEYTSYTWYMAAWKNQKIVCTITTDHPEAPLAKEVYRDCDATVYQKWVKQKPCATAKRYLCDGYYVMLVDSAAKEKEVGMMLAPASVWISLEDCEPVPSVSTHICESKPTIVFSGMEPLPNESITRIEGTYEDQTFACEATEVCKIRVDQTNEAGATLEFWAYSSYGDSSLAYTAKLRVQKVDEGDPDQLYWYVDILSSQWQGEAPATCSQTWGVFPPVGGAPEWLSTPKISQDLSSAIPYTYLASNLILQGAVNASSCPDGGLDSSGNVNQCGLEAARPAVIAWQNQFDELILNTALETNVPAHLLKNLFARESQFWPGIYQAVGDVGLGQLTENGADTTLFWNSSFYNQFCPLVLDAEVCGAGYMHLDEEYKQSLRRALVGSVNASCEDCPLGLDLSQADFSVGVFAHTMTANCEQTAQVIYNYTGQLPGEVATYEDLWKFTLVNYNAGGSCLAEALTRAQGEDLALTWENVSPFLNGACSGAVDYVNDISQ
ncbi:MAG: hypothetical protein LC108_01310 [Anaerolineales bacterium]|nr:hypothetical protein [Anaerolineales bacterium]